MNKQIMNDEQYEQYRKDVESRAFNVIAQLQRLDAELCELNIKPFNCPHFSTAIRNLREGQHWLMRRLNMIPNLLTVNR